jgi:hypothetical protein
LNSAAKARSVEKLHASVAVVGIVVPGRAALIRGHENDEVVAKYSGISGVMKMMVVYQGS